jgi:nicotinamidase-related amidase
VPELAPLASEAIFDRLSMSASEGTPLEFALRDAQVTAFAIIGVAMEVGIEPTVRRGADLGPIPVVITDACGAGEPRCRKALARRVHHRRRRHPDRHLDVHRPPRPATDGRPGAETTATARECPT